jgi:large subunit ribosomal protein L3
MLKIKTKKIKMTQIWQQEKVVPVTILGLEEEQALLENLKVGDRVNARGVSKGKGFQGVVKRHGFHGGPKTHGQKNRLRAPGSLGSTAPQRVIKGKKMAGHTGFRNVTIKNLLVAEINLEEKLLKIRGAVPGNRGSKILISKNS